MELGAILRHCKHYIRLQTFSVELQEIYVYITLYGCVGVLYSSYVGSVVGHLPVDIFRAVFCKELIGTS